MALITMDDTELKALEIDLKFLKERAFPFATKATINSAAFKTRGVARKRISRQFITRNQFTLQSVQVEQARTLQVSRQAAFVGSTADYMETQEFGGVERKTGKHGASIPTTIASGEGENVQPRKGQPTQDSRLKVLQLRRRRKRPKGQPKNNKQALLFKVQDAVQSGNRVFYHDFKNGTKGIFRVVGAGKSSGRSTKRGWPKGAGVKMLFDLSEPAVVIPSRPWLTPSTLIVEKLVPGMYLKALKFQLNKHGLLGK